MLMAFVGFLILLFVALIFGTITYPTQDELVLILSSLVLLVFAWLYKREKSKEEQ